MKKLTKCYNIELLIKDIELSWTHRNTEREGLIFIIHRYQSYDYIVVNQNILLPVQEEEKCEYYQSGFTM